MKKQQNFFILISGIIGLLTTIIFVWASWIFGILAFVFGYKNRKNRLAKIGFILGILTLIILVFTKIILPLSTGISTSLIIFESCSMHHNQKGFSEIFEKSQVYFENSISLSDTKGWNFQNGLNKGDLVFIASPKNFEIGDIILFRINGKLTILHRLISINPVMAKGDNNEVQLSNEKSIEQSQIIGKASFRIPFVGWSKLIFSDYKRVPYERGFC